jgi:hypothetical protein
VLVLFISLAVFTGGCGYYFPHVYDGPKKTIYMPQWKNRTSQLGFDAKIYQSLSRWFQKSNSIELTKNREDADLILAGEIVSIDLNSVSWSADARSTTTKVVFKVRYVLKDIKSDKILWEVPIETWTEAYSAEGGSTLMAGNEREALERILTDISERIFLGTIDKIRRSNMNSGENR